MTIGAPADDWGKHLNGGWKALQTLTNAPPAPVVMDAPVPAPEPESARKWVLADDWMNMPR